MTRYDRSPLDLSDTRFRASFLRTVPAKNPRTECCCQPVIFMIVEIVAPPGLRSSVNTADCLDDPASIAFCVELKETDFGFDFRDDLDLTLDEARTALKRLYRQTAGWNALADLLRTELERVPAYYATCTITLRVCGRVRCSHR